MAAILVLLPRPFYQISLTDPVQTQQEKWLQSAQQFLWKSSYIQSDRPWAKITEWSWPLTYIVGHLLISLTPSTNFHITDYNTLFYLFSFKSLKDQIWPRFQMSQGQARIIILANLIILKYNVPYITYQVSRTSTHLFQRRKFIGENFYQTSVWLPSWSCDPDHFIKVSLTYPVQAHHEI